MGMFDTYQPDPALSCRVCGKGLIGWQGTDGPNLLLVWRQGISTPVARDIDDPEVAAALDDACPFRLPPRFTIYSYACGCPFRVEALCEAPTGTWISTTLVTLENAERGIEESKDHWARRKRWLSGGHAGTRK